MKKNPYYFEKKESWLDTAHGGNGINEAKSPNAIHETH